MGMFDGVGDADMFERGRFMPPGFRGVLEIKKTIAKESVKSGTGFIVEMEVIEVHAPGEEGHEHSPVIEGEKRTWWQGMKDKTVAFPSLKAWAGAVAGYRSDQRAEIDEALGGNTLGDMLNEATASPAENDFVGAYVELTTHEIITQKNKSKFTVHNWAPYMHDEDE